MEQDDNHTHDDHEHHGHHDEIEEDEPTTFAGKLGKFIWTCVFGLMYPILVVFALIVTGVIHVSSFLSNVIVWVISKFRK